LLCFIFNVSYLLHNKMAGDYHKEYFSPQFYRNNFLLLGYFMMS